MILAILIDGLILNEIKYLIVLLICISLMTNAVEHLFPLTVPTFPPSTRRYLLVIVWNKAR